jgi:hypothetical protein
LFGGRDYNDGTMRKLFSEMQTLAEQYLMHSAFENKSNFQRKLDLLSRLDEKKLDRIFEMTVEALNNERQKGLDDDYFKYNFELEVAKLNFRLGKGRAGFEPKNVRDNLLQCAVYLICYSLITMFKLNQDVMVTSVSIDFDYKDTIVYKFIEALGPAKFIGHIKTYALEYYPVICIYFNRFMIALGEDKDDKYYYELKEMILINIERFTRFEKYNLMLFLENSCDEKIMMGKDFKDELHDIHLKMLSMGLVTSQDNDLFPLIRFRKMILNALSLGKLEWTENFVKDYINLLPENFRENMSYYSQAYIHFKKGIYENTLLNISRVKLDVYSVKFDTWILKLQSELELGYYEEALYSVDSYKHLLRNDSSSPEWMKKRIHNFINFFHKILKVRSEENELKEFEKENLAKEILNSKDLIERKWLLEKLE